MKKHVPLVQKRHPMLPDGGTVETVCARCHESWPCTVEVLLEAAYAAMEYDAAIKQAALEERNAETRRSWVGNKSLDALYASWITRAFIAIAKAEGR